MSRKQQGPAFREFDRRVREMTSRGVARMRACELVARRNPELHRAMLCETNSGIAPAVLGAVATGAAIIHAPVQRPGVAPPAKQTAHSVAGTTLRPTTPQAAAAAPSAPVAPAAATTAVSAVAVAVSPPVTEADESRPRFNYDPMFSPYHVGFSY